MPTQNDPTCSWTSAPPANHDALCRIVYRTLNGIARAELHDNPRAIRSYQKAGFTLEGVQRQWLHRDGHRGDVVVMSILREEYAAGRAP